MAPIKNTPYFITSDLNNMPFMNSMSTLERFSLSDIRLNLTTPLSLQPSCHHYVVAFPSLPNWSN